MIVGFAEENNVALMWTEGDLFMFQLESLQLKKLLETRSSFYHPFESVYTAGVWNYIPVADAEMAFLL